MSQTLLLDKSSKLDIVVRSKNTFDVLLGLKDEATGDPIRLDDAMVRMDVNSGDKAILSFTFGHGISHVIQTGEILLFKTAEEMNITPGKYTYDLYVIMNNVKQTYLDGFFTVNRAESK